MIYYNIFALILLITIWILWIYLINYKEDLKEKSKHLNELYSENIYLKDKLNDLKEQITDLIYKDSEE